MEINTVIIDDESCLTFKKKYSRYQLVFQIRLEENKPKLRGYWNSFGGFGGGLDMNEKELWSYFLTKLKNSATKGQLEYFE